MPLKPHGGAGRGMGPPSDQARGSQGAVLRGYCWGNRDVTWESRASRQVVKLSGIELTPHPPSPDSLYRINV